MHRDLFSQTTKNTKQKNTSISFKWCSNVDVRRKGKKSKLDWLLFWLKCNARKQLNSFSSTTLLEKTRFSMTIQRLVRPQAVCTKTRVCPFHTRTFNACSMDWKTVIFPCIILMKTALSKFDAARTILESVSYLFTSHVHTLISLCVSRVDCMVRMLFVNGEIEWRDVIGREWLCPAIQFSRSTRW